MEECENCWCSLRADLPIPSSNHHRMTQRYTGPGGGPSTRHVLGISFNSPAAKPPLSPVTHYFTSQSGMSWRNYTLALIFIYLAVLIYKRFSCIIKPVIRDCPQRFPTDTPIVRQKLLSKFYTH